MTNDIVMKKKNESYVVIEQNDNFAKESILGYNAVPSTINDFINFSRSGKSMAFLNKLANNLALSLKDMSEVLQVSMRTLQRYNDNKVLDTDASAKLLQLEALQNHGIEVFGDKDAFNSWLKSPVLALGNQTPLSFLDTPFGFQLVNNTLGRIKHGIF